MCTSIILYGDHLVPSPTEYGSFVKRSFAELYWDMEEAKFEALKELGWFNEQKEHS